MSASIQAKDVAGSVATEPDLAQQVAAHYQLRTGESLRIALHAGPGDAAGSFDYWMDGEHDVRVPIIAYSTQFYALAQSLGADAYIITEPPHLPKRRHNRFHFIPTARDRSRHGIGWHVEENAYAKRVLAQLRRIRPHVIVMGSDLPSWFYAALPRDTALIITMHNTFWPMGRRPTGTKARLKQALRGWGLRRMSAAVCTSPECARQLATLTGRQEGLFVEIPQISAARLPALHPRTAASALLYLGRIEANKGVFDLLTAFSTLASHHPDITLTFAGTGSAAPALKEAIYNAPHGDRIHYSDQLSAEGVIAALQRADLLVCPTRSSFNEGLALVVIEAAAMGVPSVVSSVVPAQEHVPDGCAVFPADDTVSLERSLAAVIESSGAYQALAKGTASTRAGVLDRTRSWGSQLAHALLIAH
ncbi:MAG TPA: glycosyltransferase family 4 protein [Paracoccus sp.]|nr:glycosyltransferase family 4 protein [Paracoccus sp. (in: a-proteobacteria)]